MKILLPEGSSMSARDIVYALGRRHQIDVLDPSLFCQLKYSSLVRRVYRCPLYWREPEEYLDFLLRRLRQEKYDVLLPTHEQTYLLSRFRELIGRHVGLAVPEFPTIERLQSKASFARLLKDLGLPTPPTRIVRDQDEFLKQDEFPCFVKVDFSTAGNGVQIVRSAEELRKAAAVLAESGTWDGQTEVLLQEQAKGTQSASLAIFDNGRLLGGISYVARKPGVGGWVMNGESVSHPRAIEHLEKLGEYLNYHGPLFVDYFHDDATGRIAYIEANPRFGWAFFPQLAGLPFGQLFLDLSLGRSVERLPEARVGVRFHQTFVMLISAAAKGASRRALAKKVFQACRHRGFFESSHDNLTRPREDWLSIVPAAAVTALLLLKPSAADWLVRRTLANFTLPAEGARAIREMAAPNVADPLPPTPANPS